MAPQSASRRKYNQHKRDQDSEDQPRSRDRPRRSALKMFHPMRGIGPSVNRALPVTPVHKTTVSLLQPRCSVSASSGVGAWSEAHAADNTTTASLDLQFNVRLREPTPNGVYATPPPKRCQSTESSSHGRLRAAWQVRRSNRQTSYAVLDFRAALPLPCRVKFHAVVVLERQELVIYHQERRF